MVQVTLPPFLATSPLISGSVVLGLSSISKPPSWPNIFPLNEALTFTPCVESQASTPVMLTPDSAMTATIMVGSPSSPALRGGALNSTNPFGRCSRRFARSRRERPLISIVASLLIDLSPSSQYGPYRTGLGAFNELYSALARNAIGV